MGQHKQYTEADNATRLAARRGTLVSRMAEALELCQKAWDLAEALNRLDFCHTGRQDSAYGSASTCANQIAGAFLAGTGFSGRMLVEDLITSGETVAYHVKRYLDEADQNEA